MTPDVQVDAGTLRAKALAQLPPRADTRAPLAMDGTDATGAVRVTLDVRGRVVAAEVRRGWSARLVPDDLPAAVFDAYIEALRLMSEAAAVAALAADVAGERSPDVPAVPPERSPRPERAASVRERLAAMRATIRDTGARWQEVRRMSAGGEPAVHEYPGARGCLTAVVQGSTVVGVAGDPRRIQGTDAEDLGGEVLEVLAAVGPAGGGLLG